MDWLRLLVRLATLAHIIYEIIVELMRGPPDDGDFPPPKC